MVCFVWSLLTFTPFKWPIHAKFHFKKPFLTERSFPLSIFLISHKILQRNIVGSKHPFSCLHGDTLSGNTHYFHTLNSRVIFFNRERSRHLSSYTTYAFEHWTLLLLFYPILLAPLIHWRGTRNCFYKTSCNSRSIWHTARRPRVLVEKIMNYRIQALCRNFDRQRYKSVWRE